MNNTDSWTRLDNGVWYWIDVPEGRIRYRYNDCEGSAQIDFEVALLEDPNDVYRILESRAYDFKCAVDRRYPTS